MRIAAVLPILALAQLAALEGGASPSFAITSFITPMRNGFTSAGSIFSPCRSPASDELVENALAAPAHELDRAIVTMLRKDGNDVHCAGLAKPKIEEDEAWIVLGEHRF